MNNKVKLGALVALKEARPNHPVLQDKIEPRSVLAVVELSGGASITVDTRNPQFGLQCLSVEDVGTELIVLDNDIGRTAAEDLVDTFNEETGLVLPMPKRRKMLSEGRRMISLGYQKIFTS